MASVVTPLNRFMRTAIQPYWCEGSPLAWQVEGVGIARFAEQGCVGKFNLAWWLLGRAKPPRHLDVYQTLNLGWVLMTAPASVVAGRTLVEHASYCTLAEWQRFVLSNQHHAALFEGHGVTYEQLTYLALVGERNST